MTLSLLTHETRTTSQHVSAGAAEVSCGSTSYRSRLAVGVVERLSFTERLSYQS